MKRIFLFLLTNLAVVFVLSIALRLLGIERILDEQGTGLDLNPCWCSPACLDSAER